MKIAAIVDYIPDKAKVKANWPAHQVYLRGLLEDGRLCAAGPFGDGAGALWILEVETIEAGEEIVRGDPFVTAGVCASWKVRPFAYWSAQECKGKPDYAPCSANSSVIESVSSEGLSGVRRMARNTVQFQKGLSEPEFNRRYGTEEQCREVVLTARWPQGFRCPGCASQRHSMVTTRDLFQCSDCRLQTSPTAGTIFASTKLPLRTWFRAFYHMTQTKQGISSIELGRRLGVTQTTAWKINALIAKPVAICDAARLRVGEVGHGFIDIRDLVRWHSAPGRVAASFCVAGACAGGG